MAILFDSDSKKPQPWAYLFFIFFTILLLAAVFFFGMRRADQMNIDVSNTEKMFEGGAD